MSESGVKQSRSETIPWHGDWQRGVSQEQRDQAQSLFTVMMEDYCTDHIMDHASEAIQTVLDQAECRRGRLDEKGPTFKFSFTRNETPIYLTAEFLAGGRSLYFDFTNWREDA